MVLRSDANPRFSARSPKSNASVCVCLVFDSQQFCQQCQPFISRRIALSTCTLCALLPLLRIMKFESLGSRHRKCVKQGHVVVQSFVCISWVASLSLSCPKHVSSSVQSCCFYTVLLRKDWKLFCFETAEQSVCASVFKMDFEQNISRQIMQEWISQWCYV